jgi:hypothetical protein
MTEIADRSAAAPATRGWVPAVAIAANVFAISTVMFWIYYARAMFIALHPDYVAVEPPTISRAISDPAIGVPFHLWVSVSGALLVFGVFWIATFNRRLHAHAGHPAAHLSRMMRIGMPTVVMFQMSSAVGMYLLSGYRFPDHHQAHMLGSYTFFISQAMVVMIGTILSAALLREKAVLAQLHAAGLLHPGMVRFRKWSGVFCMALTVSYVFLFQAKNMDFGVLNAAVYVAYTSVEPALITCFLLFLALFQTDLLALRRLQRRS